MKKSFFVSTLFLCAYVLVYLLVSGFVWLCSFTEERLKVAKKEDREDREE